MTGKTTAGFMVFPHAFYGAAGILRKISWESELICNETTHC